MDARSQGAALADLTAFQLKADAGGSRKWGLTLNWHSGRDAQVREIVDACRHVWAERAAGLLFLQIILPSSAYGRGGDDGIGPRAVGGEHHVDLG